MAENSPAGALITRLDATDADSGEFGELRYELRGFGSERFSVNSSTGDLLAFAVSTVASIMRNKILIQSLTPPSMEEVGNYFNC